MFEVSVGSVSDLKSIVCQTSAWLQYGSGFLGVMTANDHVVNIDLDKGSWFGIIKTAPYTLPVGTMMVKTNIAMKINGTIDIGRVQSFKV
jgi:hypothetical protein